MACSKQLRTEFLSGADTGGVWALEGYNATSDAGPFAGGGSWPWTTSNNDDVVVDFSDVEQGWYKLSYYATGDCGDSVDVVIGVKGGADGSAGPVTVDKCIGDAEFNVWDRYVNLLGASYEEGPYEVTGAWSGNATSAPGWTPGGHFTESTFDPDTEGTYTLILTLTPVDMPGYSQVSCDNCDPLVMELTIVVSAPYSAGGDSFKSICEGAPAFDLLGEVTGSPSTVGNWRVISGDASAFSLSNDDNGANDMFDPGAASVGFHVVEYETLPNGGCPGQVSVLTIEVVQTFNTGGGTWIPINLCDFQGTGNEGRLKDLYNAWLATQNNQPVDDGGRWLYWGHRFTDCSGAWQGGGQIEVDGGGCETFSVFENIAPGEDNPLVKLDCEANTACIAFIYAAPEGAPCGGSNLVIFAPDNCAGCTCDATITEDNCSAEVTPISCTNPTYQWQEWNGSTWVNIPGQTSATYTGDDGDIVRCVVNDDNCAPFNTQSVQLSCTPSCTGSVTASRSGCTINSSISGITGPSYQWQSRPIAGGTWTNISGATSSSYSIVDNNKQYRVRVTSGACQYFSNIIYVQIGITASINSCEASVTITNGLGGTQRQWQRSPIGAGTWTNISGATGVTYTSTQDEDLRCRVTFTGGCQFYSNTVTANCGTPTCTLQIDSIYVDGCDVVCLYSGYSGSQTIQWSAADNNSTPGSCAGSGGWNTSGVGTVDNSTPGVSRLTPARGTRCYRIIIDDIAGQGAGCLANSEIWYEQCCNGSVTINDDTCTYSIDAYFPGNPGNNTQCQVEFQAGEFLAHIAEFGATRDCGGGAQSYGSTEERTFLEHRTGNTYQVAGGSGINIGQFIEHVKIYRNDGGVETSHNIDLSSVVHTNQGAAVFQSQLRAAFVSGMSAIGCTEGTHYRFLQFIVAQVLNAYVVTIRMASKNRTGAQKWAGIKKSDNEIVVNRGGFTSTYPASGQSGYQSFQPQQVSRTTDCGNTIRVTATDNYPYIPSQINDAASDYDVISYTENPVEFDKSYNPQTAQCVRLTANVSGGTASSYLWSTGATTQVIYVQAGAGTISVTVETTDGCSYQDSINI